MKKNKLKLVMNKRHINNMYVTRTKSSSLYDTKNEEQVSSHLVSPAQSHIDYSRLGFRPKIDCLELTHPDQMAAEVFVNTWLHPLDDWAPIGNFAKHQKTVHYQGMSFSTGGPSGYCKLNITGQACAGLSQSRFQSELDWRAFFVLLKQAGFSFKRADYAYDFHQGGLVFKTLANKLRKGHYKSMAKTRRFVDAVRKGVESQTLYIGSEKRLSRLIRIYEKTAMDAKYLRVEFSCGDKWAERNADTFIRQGFLGVIPGIGTFLCFLNKTRGDMNKRRWKAYGPWMRFIQSASKKPLLSIDPESLLEYVDLERLDASTKPLHHFRKAEGWG